MPDTIEEVALNFMGLFEDACVRIGTDPYLIFSRKEWALMADEMVQFVNDHYELKEAE